MAVRLAGDRYAEARFFSGFQGVLWGFPTAAVIAVDIPIGLLPRGRRRADEEARRILGPRRNSVFFVPPRPALEAPTFEVDRLASDRRIVGVHPEVSFCALNQGTPLPHRKNSWNGLMMRLELLRNAGLELPPAIDGLDDAQPDDVVDAAPEGLEHLDQQAHDAAGCVELAALLALGAGELAQEVLVNAAEHVLGPGVGVAHADVGDQVDQLSQALPV
ncbi:MAG: DUF429 domain-containing protein [Armatimonadetes bacterium]|nr:DUF429 domain-containing protein [Armatimonadota bacterium]